MTDRSERRGGRPALGAKGALALGAALGLAACGAQYGGMAVLESAVDDAEAASAALAGGDQGVVAFSLASDPADTVSFFQRVRATPNLSLTLQVENVATQERYQFRQDPEILAAVPLTDADEAGDSEVHAHALPAGRYRITNVTVFWFGGGADGPVQREWAAAEEFSVPFRVAAGEAHYLGEWRCLPQTEDDGVGRPAFAGCLFAVSDHYERDAPALQARYGQSAWTRLRNDTLREGDAPPGLIDFRSPSGSE